MFAAALMGLWQEWVIYGNTVKWTQNCRIQNCCIFYG